jgi:hypothetical protein
MSNSMPIRVVRETSRPLCIVLLWICCTMSAQNEDHSVRNIVLVHGAWADGSGWKGVYDILVKTSAPACVVWPLWVAVIDWSPFGRLDGNATLNCTGRRRPDRHIARSQKFANGFRLAIDIAPQRYSKSLFPVPGTSRV